MNEDEDIELRADLEAETHRMSPEVLDPENE